MPVFRKQVAFDVTPLWWGKASPRAKQLILATAGALVPQRTDINTNLFAISGSVFAYDIEVPEDVTFAELEDMRGRIVESLDVVRDMLPYPWADSDLIDTARWVLRGDSAA
jgi:hypothetical protein